MHKGRHLVSSRRYVGIRPWAVIPHRASSQHRGVKLATVVRNPGIAAAAHSGHCKAVTGQTCPCQRRRIIPSLVYPNMMPERVSNRTDRFPRGRSTMSAAAVRPYSIGQVPCCNDICHRHQWTRISTIRAFYRYCHI